MYYTLRIDRHLTRLSYRWILQLKSSVTHIDTNIKVEIAHRAFRTLIVNFAQEPDIYGNAKTCSFGLDVKNTLIILSAEPGCHSRDTLPRV